MLSYPDGSVGSPTSRFGRSSARGLKKTVYGVDVAGHAVVSHIWLCNSILERVIGY